MDGINLPNSNVWCCQLLLCLVVKLLVFVEVAVYVLHPLLIFVLFFALL